MKRYQWEDRERFYFETDTHRIFVDPHTDWHPGYSVEELNRARAGFHSGATEIHYEMKHTGNQTVKVSRSLYPKCIRCSKSIADVIVRPELNNALLCTRCHDVCKRDEHNSSTVWYEILPDGTKGKVIQ
jgi:hypothetical protein